METVLSALEDVAPNATLLPAPNLKPDVAAGCSDFFSSLASVPNLKPPDEPPNLNPAEGAVSFEVLSDKRYSFTSTREHESGVISDVPNLNPPDTESEPEVVSDVPNLNPPDTEPEAVVVPDVPNLNPPEVELLEPNAEEVPAAFGSTLAPGLAV